MKRILSLAAFFALFAIPASAQTGTPASSLAWDQSATNLATANGYAYSYYADGAVNKTVLPSVCVGTASPFQCTAAFPAFTPGAHTLQITAGNIAGESAKSTTLSFTFVVQPSIPTNLRIVP